MAEGPAGVGKTELAKALAALNHPNITQIYAIEESDDDMFIAMEYVDGQELKSIVGAGSQPALIMDEIVNIAIQIAEGLKAVNDKNIIYRDIKLKIF